MDGYIDRAVIKETEKAYLVEQVVNNRRDGSHINYRWVSKKLCRPMSEGRQKVYDQIPDEFKHTVPFYIGVPTWIIGNGEWD